MTPGICFIKVCCIMNLRYIDILSRGLTLIIYVCSNNADDVRDQWEKIKLSYEILSDKKTRLRYDRNTFLSDPSKAVQKAALNAVGKGLSSVFSAAGKGIFKLGSLAADSISGKNNNDDNDK